MKNNITTIISYNYERVRRFFEESHQGWIRMGYLGKLRINRNEMYCYLIFDKDAESYYGWEWFSLNHEPRGKIFNKLLIDVNIPVEVLEKYILPRFRGNMDTDIKYLDLNEE